jgi:hypothetical protein
VWDEHGQLEGDGWFAWVRDCGDCWRWDALALDMSASWQVAESESAAKAAAFEHIRQHAAKRAAAATAILDAIAALNDGPAPSAQTERAVAQEGAGDVR